MKNMMKETQSVVDVVSLDGKSKGVSRPVAYEGEKYILKENEMVFYLRELPGCQIHGVAEWCENSKGDIVKEIDTYFRHILTGQRCDTPWSCILGVAEFNEYHEETWETLCMRIANHENIEEDMCYEKEVCV